MWAKGGEQTAALRLLQRLVFYWDMYVVIEFLFSDLLGLSMKHQSHLEHRRSWDDGELSGAFERHRKFMLLLGVERPSFI